MQARRVGVTLPSVLGYGVSSMSVEAERRNADLFVAHSEPAMWVANRLLRSGRRVGVDMEDWYSEDYAVPGDHSRPRAYLRRLEGSVLRQAVHSTTTSVAMSEALAGAFGCRPPAAIYNAFPFGERSTIDGKNLDRPSRGAPSLHWYSQTLGPRRGLEQLAAALPIMKKVEIHLRGTSKPGFRDWMISAVPHDWRGHIHFHELVPSTEVISRIAEHDIGYAGEMTHCRSRDLTVTNKILHYMLGGLAVVASATSGQREVAQGSGEAIRLFDPESPQSLAAAVNALVDSPDLLARARRDALEAAERRFCWERQADRLLESVAHALVARR